MKIYFNETKEYKTNIQKSIFISYCTYVDSVEKAEVFIKKYSDKSASHNCWAYKIKEKENYTDDREPSGTAGRPIFNSIKSLSLDYVVVLIIRFFGGKKLGIRGLIDAYSKAAR
jgi:putative IMPACT (imprinted ancient) family translation regulator